MHNSQYKEHSNSEALKPTVTGSVTMGGSQVTYSVNAAHATLIK